MAQSRQKLHDIFLLFVPNVYFEPPPTTVMEYPCIVYHRNDADTKFANNFPYQYTKRYSVMVIDDDGDSELPDMIAALPMCLFNRFYTADNLNHDVFNLFF